MGVAPEFIAGASTLPLKGAALVAAKRLDGLARGAPMSASELERNALLGIAYTESYFDSNAIGDEGKSFGWFQHEKGAGVTEADQVKNSVTRVRAALESLSANNTGEAAPFLDKTPSAIIKLLKASWQVAERRLGEWIADLKSQVLGLKNVVAIQRATGVAGPYSNMSDEEAVKGMLGGIQGPANFVIWLGTKGAKIPALEQGQQRITAFETYYKWVPSEFIDGKVTGSAGASKDDIWGSMAAEGPGLAGDIYEGGKRAAKNAFSLAGQAVSGAIGSLVGGMSQGATQVLPYVGMGLAGYLAYKLWNSGRKKQPEVVYVRGRR